MVGGVRGGCACWGGAWRGSMVGEHVWQEGGMHGWGACMVGGMHGEGCIEGGMCGRGVCVAGGMCGRRDGHCSGWYASYWNAFLLVILFHF